MHPSLPSQARMTRAMRLQDSSNPRYHRSFQRISPVANAQSFAKASCKDLTMGPRTRK